MSSHPSMQRLRKELASSSRRSDRGQVWKTGCPPVPTGWLVVFIMAISWKASLLLPFPCGRKLVG